MSARNARKDASSEAIQAPRLRTLLLTDLCDSTALVERIGDNAAAALFREHDRLVVKLQQHWRGRLIDRSDGLLLLFDRPIDGLGFALDYARGLKAMSDAHAQPLCARQGLHVGEVLTWRNSDEAVSIGAKPLEVEGLAKPTAARLMSMARPGQILISAVAESLTHRAARELGDRVERILWKSHGRWRFKGVPTPMEIYEVGEIGLTPLRAPKNSTKAWRDVPLWRRPAALVAEVGVVLAVGIAVWFFVRPQPAIAFAKRDWVVVGDLTNLTGDGLMDGSLDQAFRISLEQSRYVNVLGDDRVLKALEMMRKDPTINRLDRATASEVAVRLGVKAVLLPSIASVGGRTRFAVEVVEPQSQQTLAVSTAFGSGSSVLAAVDQVAQDLRDRLGEDAKSIQQQSHPLPEVTTSSLDALRAYALGQRRYARGDYENALGFYRKATDIDPQFALAWLGQTRAYFAKVDYANALAVLARAKVLIARLPAREAMYVENWDTQIVNPPAATDGWIRMAELYPDYAPASHNAAIGLYAANRFGDALPYAKRVADSKVDLTSIGLDQYGRILLALGDFETADYVLGRAVKSGWSGALRRQASVAAAKKDFAKAWQLLARVPENNYHADIERTSVALDSNDVFTAVVRSESGLRNGPAQSGADQRIYYVPAATAKLMSGNAAAAISYARKGAKGALDALDHESAADAIDDMAIALAAALVAQQAGDQTVATMTLQRLETGGPAKDNRLISELEAIVRAERRRVTGKPLEALLLLEPFLDTQSRIQTRAAAMRAAADAGNQSMSREHASWLRARRGMAYAEAECGYCLQPLNVVAVDAATDQFDGS
ncbi:putative peptide modification system cyclase [Xanthomonas cannabis]|uniref:Peptide modification system cyclase n=1 Tax=Xanthomonas cannabis TaxID=1885674 RepID=A0ABR6JN62_9XANT|nr:putative peptide modification system cyclase [Xanthomonas cannabis]MBB4593746.1 putative peptide modification system cyclase [Xanthomonas cannabis]MBB5522318.1 putative peptide modification system cyclase [Xanthomonas cannabis]